MKKSQQSVTTSDKSAFEILNYEPENVITPQVLYKRTFINGAPTFKTLSSLSPIERQLSTDTKTNDYALAISYISRTQNILLNGQDSATTLTATKHGDRVTYTSPTPNTRLFEVSIFLKTSLPDFRFTQILRRTYLTQL
jgi:hypothetical protein